MNKKKQAFTLLLLAVLTVVIAVLPTLGNAYSTRKLTGSPARWQYENGEQTTVSARDVARIVAEIEAKTGDLLSGGSLFDLSEETEEKVYYDDVETVRSRAVDLLYNQLGQTGEGIKFLLLAAEFADWSGGYTNRTVVLVDGSPMVLTFHVLHLNAAESELELIYEEKTGVILSCICWLSGQFMSRYAPTISCQEALKAMFVQMTDYYRNTLSLSENQYKCIPRNDTAVQNVSIDFVAQISGGTDPVDTAEKIKNN